MWRFSAQGILKGMSQGQGEENHYMNGIKIFFGIYRGFRSGDVKVSETFQKELFGRAAAAADTAAGGDEDAAAAKDDANVSVGGGAGDR